ncbi:hypothetical protein [Lactiplantibacillus fabifermentans]|uniref:Uncharacterized protein n=2 Tax=Lactiplantibacillus fabifermentans TaxID=483011 RepID=A0A0R2NXK8_9LACO|nr:hypothetical protein [Lactiplantibacillus fabifermentans]ETY73229.1 hypothetical protein LFAB_13220 [Lactiplantibacillus fabifermentans T30PCM01]KRO28339.1 hypothetical protein DY78_GL002469 [Lactiplantibacillus fabifermentans DSM 21115]
MMMTGVVFLAVLMIGIILSGIFFRYMDVTAGVSFGSLKLTDFRSEGLNVLLMIALLMWALILIH